MKKLITLTAGLVLSVVGASAQSMYVKSQNGNVNVRTAPSASAQKVGSLTPADLALCVDNLDGWYKIDFNGKEAYVAQSVTATCDAVIPAEMFGKDIQSSKPWDKIRHQGTIRLDKIDDKHAAIHMDWMRVNLPAESTTYIADIKDGRIIVTHGTGMWIDTDKPLKKIMEEMGEPLSKPIPVGFDEFGNTLYFNGATFSEYN